jgi:hypothetical protein
VDGVVHQQQSPPTASGQQQQQQQQQLQVALITLPPPREVARPEMPRDSVLSTGRVDEEEWVTVFGYVLSSFCHSIEQMHSICDGILTLDSCSHVCLDCLVFCNCIVMSKISDLNE